MSSPIISVDNLSKRYIIQRQRCKDDGLRHRIEDAVRSPWRWAHRLVQSHSRHSGLRARSSSSEHSALDLRRPTSASQVEFWALNDVSFEVNRGDVVGIIGRNGAGKSTLLKILSRITEPSRGTIRLNGRVASLLEVGTGFHPDLTGRENIFLNGAILGMTRYEIAKKFDEIVAFAEIEQFLDTPVKRYSSGMYVRLAFAVAAHLEPEILVVDEVLAVGDTTFQKKCLQKMEGMHSTGRTVLFVSHNMLAVQQLCSRCLLLRDGTLAASGPVRDIVDQYLRVGSSAVFSHERHPELPRITGARTLTPAVRTDSSLEIFVEWFLPRPVPGIKVGVGFNTADGARIFDCGPEDLGFTSPQTAGYHCATVRIPPDTLLARSYGISVGLWKDSHSFHHVSPALIVSVEPGPSGPYAHQSTRDGVVHLRCDWVHIDVKETEETICAA